MSTEDAIAPQTPVAISPGHVQLRYVQRRNHRHEVLERLTVFFLSFRVVRHELLGRSYDSLDVVERRHRGGEDESVKRRALRLLRVPAHPVDLLKPAVVIPDLPPKQRELRDDERLAVVPRGRDLVPTELVERQHDACVCE